MRQYKGYTHQQRMSNLKLVKQKISDGQLEDPMNLKCQICGLEKGIREYHCFDYNPQVALKSLNVLCWTCHRKLHVYELGQTHKYYQQAKEYFEKIKDGYKPKPVYRTKQQQQFADPESARSKFFKKHNEKIKRNRENVASNK